jgi:hypothetical protein
MMDTHQNGPITDDPEGMRMILATPSEHTSQQLNNWELMLSQKHLMPTLNEEMDMMPCSLSMVDDNVMNLPKPLLRIQKHDDSMFDTMDHHDGEHQLLMIKRNLLSDFDELEDDSST